MLLDTQSGNQARAAIAIGDPDTASTFGHDARTQHDGPRQHREHDSKRQRTRKRNRCGSCRTHPAMPLIRVDDRLDRL